MINLTNNDKEEMLKKEKGYLLKNNKKYYYKLALPSLEGMELVIEDLAKLVDIKCANYEMLKIDDMYFYISLDVGYPNQFITASSLGIKSTNLYDIWDYLEKISFNNSKELMLKIIKIYLFDILIVNPDRRYINWGFIINNNKILDVCILDNELSFTFNNLYISTNGKDYKIKEIPKEYIKGINDLFDFLYTSSNDFIELFKEMYNVINPKVVKEILQKHILDENDQLDMFRVFEENYTLITNLLNKNLVL